MPAATAYRRSPLVDPAFVPLSDAAIHAEGLPQALIQQALPLVDVGRMTSLDSVLATKLGGYAQLPPAPDVESALPLLQKEPARYVEMLRAAAMLAAVSRDKEGMLRVLAGAQALLSAMPQMTEDQLFWCGADALRLAADLYRRTGQKFLLTLLEALRAQLPDVSGLMHMFPFQREYRREGGGQTPEEKLYFERMERFATGKGAADALAMTSFLAQYSGSGRDAAAPAAGLAALNRFHGTPSGAFSADPYLAGRDPARAAELGAVCAYAEACFDALCQTGEMSFAEKLEELLVNALPDALVPGGVRALQPANRLPQDESCQARKPDAADASALLRALYALKRSVWLQKDDDSLAYMLPVDGGCLSRVAGVPVRLTARVSGGAQKTVVLRAECKQPVTFTLLLRIPSYADGASVSVNGARPVTAAQGELYALRRPFQSGDEITLSLSVSPRLAVGYRGSASVYLGSQLMALPLPGADAAWRYALAAGAPMTAAGENEEACVLVAACEAAQWKEKAGFILPPPQGVPMGAAYELTLLPYAGADGRIAAFPMARAQVG